MGRIVNTAIIGTVDIFTAAMRLSPVFTAQVLVNNYELEECYTAEAAARTALKADMADLRRRLADSSIDGHCDRLVGPIQGVNGIYSLALLPAGSNIGIPACGLEPHATAKLQADIGSMLKEVIGKYGGEYVEVIVSGDDVSPAVIDTSKDIC